jgi:hypothetical protein
MNLNSAIGIISSIALIIPVILILALRLFTNKSFLALAIYYLIVSVQNLMTQNVIITPKWFYNSLGIINNFLDAPLMLIFLVFFSVSALMTKRITASIFIFLGFEAIILIFYGFTVKSVRIILGPDIAIVLTLSFIFFLRNVRLAITNSKSLGKAIMVSSVLLSYTIFSVVYIFYYLIKNAQYKDDAYLIYYLVTILSAFIMSIGILIENKRIKKLGELKHTRKELATIYGEKKVAALNKDSRFLSII